LWFRVWGSEFGARGSGFRGQDAEFKAERWRAKIHGFEFRVHDLGFMDEG